MQWLLAEDFDCSPRASYTTFPSGSNGHYADGMGTNKAIEKRLHKSFAEFATHDRRSASVCPLGA